jgi:hypothetical protein
MLKLLKARKNKLFKGLFKISKNGKIINFIMSKQEIKSMKGSKETPRPSVSENNSPDIVAKSNKDSIQN